VKKQAKVEAKTVMAEELEAYRGKPYEELAGLVGKNFAYEKAGPSGAMYQIEIDVVWDDRRKGNVRVFCSIDDGGWRAFVPLTDSFIKSPSGQFVGE